MLIVDDNPQVRRLVRGITNDLSDEFFECEDGDEVLAAFGRHVPDWIVMDVEMARMDGIEATTAIRQREQTTGNRVRIIAMTAHALKGDRERCLESGMDGYLTKPIRPKSCMNCWKASLLLNNLKTHRY